MLRLIGFFVFVWFCMRLLMFVPVIGPLLARSGFFGFWAVAIVVSLGASALAQRLTAQARLRRRKAELLAVETPNNRGKVCLMELKLGQPKRAIENLQVAFEGQPAVNDWAFGLGLAHLKLGDYQNAGRYFARVVTEDPTAGFGQPFLGLAHAAIGVGRPADALPALDDFDSRFGAAPESAFWRGVAFKRLHRKAEASAAFDQVGKLSADLPSFQRGRRIRMAWRMFWARHF